MFAWLGHWENMKERDEERCPLTCVPESQVGAPGLRVCLGVRLSVLGGCYGWNCVPLKRHLVPANGTLSEAVSLRMIKLRRGHDGGPILQDWGPYQEGTFGHRHRPCEDTEQRLQGEEYLRPLEARGAGKTPPHGLRRSEALALSIPSSWTSASGTESPRFSSWKHPQSLGLCYSRPTGLRGEGRGRVRNNRVCVCVRAHLLAGLGT